VSKSKQQHDDRSFLDPWCRDHQGDLPLSGHRIGAWSLYVGIDHIAEELFLVRTETDDSLWVRSALNRGCVAGASVKGSEAATQLVDALVHARLPFAAPVPPYLPGLLTTYELANLVEAVIAEQQRNVAAAEAAQHSDEAPIITLSRKLGLDPRPTGQNDRDWIADCPRRKHSMMISPGSNQFGCGYCRRGGGVADLQAFYDEVRLSSERLPPSTLALP
jgi:hypothetical protein